MVAPDLELSHSDWSEKGGHLKRIDGNVPKTPVVVSKPHCLMVRMRAQSSRSELRFYILAGPFGVSDR